MGVYLHLIPAGVGRAGDCIYVNTPLKAITTPDSTAAPGQPHSNGSSGSRRLWMERAGVRGGGEPDTLHNRGGEIESDTT